MRSEVFEAVSVASGSMEPTLFVGGHYFVNRLVYKIHAPRRGDIIVFTSPLDQATGLIKRVIAVPGDQVQIRSKDVYVNGQRLDEPYVIHKRAKEELDGDNLGPLQVPEDSVFVLGDNRDESFDSSVWQDAKGNRVFFLPFANIKGKLIQLI